MTRYIATFYPQQSIRWLGGDCYPADPQGDTDWDCTDYLNANYPLSEIELIINDGIGSELTDSVRDDPAAPEWIREWDGPFEVRVEEVDPE